MPVHDSANDNAIRARPIAAVALTVLFLLGLAGGWALLANDANERNREIQVESPARQ